MNTLKLTEENVFHFLVSENGESPAVKLKRRFGKTGIVTAVFFQAREPNEKRHRNIGETGQGEVITINIQLRPVWIEPVASSVVSIRYNR